MLKPLFMMFMLLISVVGYAQDKMHSSSDKLDLGLSIPLLDYDVEEKNQDFSRLLAANTESRSSMMTKKSDIPASEYKDRMFTANKVHKYLGIGSLGAAVLTVISPKEEDGPHEAFAKASGALGVAALVTGLIFHYEDLNFSNGFGDPDNLHALLAGLGSVGLAVAASEGPEKGHGGIGATGFVVMSLGIKYTW